MKSDDNSMNENTGVGGTATDWIERLMDAEKAFKEYHSQCDNILKHYEVESDKQHREMQVFWSNIEVLKPAVYARPPVPVVVPRFKDLRELPREASEILERTLISNFELQDVDCTMKEARDDYLLFGRGVVWLRYVASGGEVEGEGSDTISSEGEKVDFSESAIVEHLSRQDFRHDPARKWAEVSWVAKRAYMTKEKFMERFETEENKSSLKMVAASKMEDGTGTKHGTPKIEVWEIWDKATRKVIWVSTKAPDVLDEKDPILQLQGFFPCPRPAYGVVKAKSMVPIPEFKYYKDQVEEINELTARISKLSEALKMKGFYDAGASEIKDAIEKAIQSESNNAILIPVSSTTAFGGKSLRDSIAWLPVQEVAVIVNQLIGVRKQIIQDIYEITGISDIVRGATDPNETASAQKLKAQWGSVRIRERQGELARLARDTTRLMSEIMAENYQPETLLQMSQVQIARQEKIEMQVQQITQGAEQHLATVRDPQQQQQITKQVQAQVQKLQKTITIEKVIQFLRDQRTRAFSIEIEVDSTIQPDEDAEKQRRTEFLTSIGGFIAQMLPMVQQVPQTAPFAAEALRFAAGGFRAGRQLEGTIQEMADQLKELPKMSEKKGPSPEEIKAKTDAELAKGKLEVEKMKAQAQVQKANAETQKIMRGDPPQQNYDGAKLQIEMRKMQQDAQIQREKMAIDLEIKRAEMELEAMRYTNEGHVIPAQFAHATQRIDAMIAQLRQPQNPPALIG